MGPRLNSETHPVEHTGNPLHCLRATGSVRRMLAVGGNSFLLWPNWELSIRLNNNSFPLGSNLRLACAPSTSPSSSPLNEPSDSHYDVGKRVCAVLWRPPPSLAPTFSVWMLWIQLFISRASPEGWVEPPKHFIFVQNREDVFPHLLQNRNWQLPLRYCSGFFPFEYGSGGGFAEYL